MSMGRLLVLIILPVLAILLEAAVFSVHHLWGVVPDLLLIFVTFMSVLDGRRAGGVYGFLCGLLLDLYVGRYIGVNALSLALVGYGTGFLRRQIYPEHLLAPLLAVGAGTLLNQLSVLIIMYLIGTGAGVTLTYATGAGIQTALNMVLAVPLYIWYYRSYHQGALRP